jgi:hypothetical protein
MIDRPKDRQFVADRLDRGRWKFEGVQDLKVTTTNVRIVLNVDQGMVDAHILRPGMDSKNWPQLKKLLNAILTSEQIGWISKYITDFAPLLTEVADQ